MQLRRIIKQVKLLKQQKWFSTPKNMKLIFSSLILVFVNFWIWIVWLCICNNLTTTVQCGFNNWGTPSTMKIKGITFWWINLFMQYLHILCKYKCSLRQKELFWQLFNHSNVVSIFLLFFVYPCTSLWFHHCSLSSTVAAPTKVSKKIAIYGTYASETHKP